MANLTDKLEALLAAATKTPWRWRYELGALCAANGDIVLWPDNALRPSECETVGQRMGACGQHAETRADTNAEIIVAAVNALPRLLAVVKAAEAWRESKTDNGDELRAALDALDKETT